MDSYRREWLLRSYLVSLVSLGILWGVYAADQIQRHLWVVWSVFGTSAATVCLLSGLWRHARRSARSGDRPVMSEVSNSSRSGAEARVVRM